MIRRRPFTCGRRAVELDVPPLEPDRHAHPQPGRDKQPEQQPVARMHDREEHRELIASERADVLCSSSSSTCGR
jgi:hypothetical protein